MNQRAWAIIPVKRFGVGKSRLAPALDAAGRAALSRRLFDHVFGVAASAVSPDRVVVVTPNAAIRDEAGRRGAHGLIEPEPADLNAALGSACRYAMSRGASAIAVLPSDLPFATAEDVDALIAALGAAPSVAIAPDTAGDSTNALALSPPDPTFFRFGISSFEAHRNAARAGGAEPAIVRRPGLAFDLDTPDDLRAYRERTGQRF
jgi:2-phospho-L-lactate guanylyltransferase